MDTRISLVTLGVADLDRACGFYEALGWVGQVAQDTAFFQAGPMALVLWSRASLAADSGVADPGPVEFGGIVLARPTTSGHRPRWTTSWPSPPGTEPG